MAGTHPNPPESTIRTACLKAIEQRTGWAFVKHQTGHGVRGIPDIVGGYDGVPLAVEVKKPREVRFRPGQLRQLDLALQAGVLAAVVTSRQDMELLLDAVDRLPPARTFNDRTHWELWFAQHGLSRLFPPDPRPPRTPGDA